MDKPQLADSSPRYRKLLWFTAIALICGSPWIITASHEASMDIYNQPFSWIEAESEPRRDYDKFVERFDQPETVFISWDGCTVDDPRLDIVSKTLTSDEPTPFGPTMREYFPMVFTGYKTYSELISEDVNLKPQAALARLRGTLVGEDGKTSCAIVMVSREGVLKRRPLLNHMLDRCAEETGIARDKFHACGGLFEGAEIDEETRFSSALAFPSALFSFVVAVICLRSVIMSLPIVVCAVVSQGIVLSLVYASGVQMNAVLIVLAPLVFVLTISAGVHMVNYYREALDETDDVSDAVGTMMKNGWKPTVLAVLTTATGLGSLALSEVVPIRHFGIFGAFGCLASVGLLFLLLPGALLLQKRAKTGPRVSKLGNLWSGGSSRLAGLLRQSSWVNVTLAVCLMMTCGAGIAKIQTTTNVIDLLKPESRLVQDHTWFEDNIGPLVSLDVVINFHDAADLEKIEEIEIVKAFQISLLKMDQVSAAMAAPSFFPRIPKPSRSIGGNIRRTALNVKAESNMDTFRDTGLAVDDEEGHAWRIVVRSRTDGKPYSEILDSIHATLDDAKEKFGQDRLSVMLTGSMRIVDTSQALMLSDLIHSFLLAFLIVGIIVSCMLGSIRRGIVAMVPNLFPTVVVFGAFGLADIPIDIGTMMTASVALGIAVDGTAHFLMTYRRQLAICDEESAAIEETLRTCGMAMIQSTIICGLGLAVFFLSGFIPTQRFALLMCTLLGLALLGDVVLLPSLLIGPFRKLFRY